MGGRDDVVGSSCGIGVLGTIGRTSPRRVPDQDACVCVATDLDYAEGEEEEHRQSDSKFDHALAVLGSVAFPSHLREARVLFFHLPNRTFPYIHSTSIAVSMIETPPGSDEKSPLRFTVAVPLTLRSLATMTV